MRPFGAARRILHALTRVGAPARLMGEEEGATFTASIQPVRGRQTERTGPWGIDRPGKAALYAPWDSVTARIQAGSRLCWQGRLYRVLQAQTLELAGEPLYVWGMLETEGEAQPWT